MTGLLKGIELYCRCAPIHFIGKLDRFYGSRYLLHVVILRASIIVTLVLILAAQRTKTRLSLVPRRKAEQGSAPERVNDEAFIKREKPTAPCLTLLFKIQASPLRLDRHENRVSCKRETQLDRRHRWTGFLRRVFMPRCGI